MWWCARPESICKRGRGWLAAINLWPLVADKGIAAANPCESGADTKASIRRLEIYSTSHELDWYSDLTTGTRPLGLVLHLRICYAAHPLYHSEHQDRYDFAAAAPAPAKGQRPATRDYGHNKAFTPGRRTCRYVWTPGTVAPGKHGHLLWPVSGFLSLFGYIMKKRTATLVICFRGEVQEDSTNLMLLSTAPKFPDWCSKTDDGPIKVSPASLLAPLEVS